ncbi:MAG: hypothetical protein KJ950_16860 [Proteobacteria bacterium]|nr:hypothetical protein [Pseudomonadota bacterium]MBU1688154.1 hypothetical protein [Pseudomonadota bacterium]
MGDLTELEKVRVMLPHWIEHNNSHVAEFIKWQQTFEGRSETEEAAAKFAEAVQSLEAAGAALTEALASLGGPLEHHGHHHHH